LGAIRFKSPEINAWQNAPQKWGRTFYPIAETTVHTYFAIRNFRVATAHLMIQRETAFLQRSSNQ
jgi:hypothetical protein